MISLFNFLFYGAIALAVVHFYFKRTFNYWKNKGCDGDENPSFIFGTMTDAFLGRKSFAEILNSLYHKYPGRKVVGWFKFRTPGLYVRDPEIIRKVLVNDFYHFRNNDMDVDPDSDPIMGRNIFILKDDMWKKNRALVTPAFTIGKIKNIYPEMDKVAQDLVQFLKDHPEELHVKNTLVRYTAEIVARCAFGILGNNLKDPKPKMVELGKKIFQPSLWLNFKMLCFFMMSPLMKLLDLKVVPNEVVRFFNIVLKDVIVQRQEKNIRRNDFLQYLLDVKRKTQEAAEGNMESDLITTVYTDEDVLSGCIMFFVESFETSSMLFNNILYLLAKNKGAQEKLRAEIDATLKEGELTFEKLHGMEYLHCVFAESNRLLPVLYNMQKRCTERYEMDIGKDKPLIIEKGTPVVLSVYGIHTDPLYWEDADKFKPERFFDKFEAAAKSKGIYLPFSDGPRACPGSRLATTVIKLGLVRILSELEVCPTSKTPEKIVQDPHNFMISHKDGIYLRFKQRSH